MASNALLFLSWDFQSVNGIFDTLRCNIGTKSSMIETNPIKNYCFYQNVQPYNVDQIPNINQIFYNLSYTISQFVVNLLFDDDAEHSKLLAYFLVLWLYNL